MTYLDIKLNTYERKSSNNYSILNSNRKSHSLIFG